MRPGGRPPWWRHIGTDPGLALGDIRHRFTDMTVERAMGRATPDLRRSAVAVLLSGADPGGVELLLTRRSWDMRTHRGEVSFAGGAEDDGDEFPVGTARREAAEEVGLDPVSTDVLGALDPLTTFTSDRVVLPVVLTTPGRPVVTPSPSEVDAILHVHIRDLLHVDCYHEERWSWPRQAAGAHVPAATDHPMHFFDLEGDTIWGATAAMLHQLLSILLVDPAPR
ncbi:MAG: CoA pyrophosphatase [Acidimicrobiales bacterium]